MSDLEREINIIAHIKKAEIMLDRPHSGGKERSKRLSVPCDNGKGGIYDEKTISSSFITTA